ncbi:GGDEF domain-containing protein [Colwellia sp. E2M01]|uniref:GGDEF domain-containing protein n=1 Tax=Colwellia sp. E2M01 TaxID=2841561 RepID=UPI001C095E82|nr:GGDEF domain-containing protein [Colwellia sp. E2M01]MBU2869663.1 GGDEF domain-containing protein [Colwellia sp. E2M01]
MIFYVRKWLNTLLIIGGFLVTHCLANDAINTTNIKSYKSASVTNILPVSPDLTELLFELNQSSVDRYQIEMLLIKVTLSKKTLNAAEQYLLLVIQALVKEKLESIHLANKSEIIHNKISSKDNVVELLERAEMLSTQISEAQLVQPNFLLLHLILADHYKNQDNYDLAYLEKKSYLEKYHVYRQNKRLAMIASLEKSFEMQDKKSTTALLKSQNELKVRRVADVKEEQLIQQYNFTLILGTAVVFVLLFFKQLIVRNKLVRLTLTDELTGLANRSALFESGNKMVKQFDSQPEQLSVLLLDLDHFKVINDRFGHNVGDKVLMTVAKLINETMRSRDLLSRLGGEEFVAILPYADIHKAKAIAKHINEKIAEYNFSLLMSQRHITMSIGVATLANNKMKFEDLLHCADLAMYQAKEQGRNTAVCYQNIAASQERRTENNAIELDSSWRF